MAETAEWAIRAAQQLAPPPLATTILMAEGPLPAPGERTLSPAQLRVALIILAEHDAAENGA